MDPIVISIVTAVAAGAVSAFKDDAKDAVKNAFLGIKTLITGKYPDAATSLARLEAKPTLEGRRAALAEDLDDAGAANDPDLAQHAATLIAIITKEDPDAVRAIGVELSDFEAANVTLRNIKASGTTATGVRVRAGTVRGDITIEGVTAEGTGPK